MGGGEDAAERDRVAVEVVEEGGEEVGDGVAAEVRREQGEAWGSAGSARREGACDGLDELAPAAVGGVGLGAGGAVVVVEAVGEAFGDVWVARVEAGEALHEVDGVACPARHEVGEGGVHAGWCVVWVEGEGSGVGGGGLVEQVARVEREGEGGEALDVLRIEFDGAAHGGEGGVGVALGVEDGAEHGEGLGGLGREGDGPLGVVDGAVGVARVEVEVGGDAVGVGVFGVGPEDTADHGDGGGVVARAGECEGALDGVEVLVGGPAGLARLWGGAAGHRERIGVARGGSDGFWDEPGARAMG